MSMMGTLRFVGLAVITAVAPVVVVAGSSPAHADPPNLGDYCSVQGALTRAADGTVLECTSAYRGAPMVWMGITQPTR
jgi:hypothetical protein